MVMIFQSEKALKHLMKYGYVYTVRRKRRTRTGKDWITDKRGGTKLANVNIEEIGCWEGFNWKKLLKLYVNESGFDNVEEWIKEIIRLNKKLPKKLYIYRVVLR